MDYNPLTFIVADINIVVMLTKSDLDQIRGIIKEEIKKEIKPLKRDIAVLKQDVKGLKRDVKTIKRDMNIIISTFDNEYMNPRQRVNRIEKHLGIPSN